jgi:hypothetical protein
VNESSSASTAVPPRERGRARGTGLGLALVGDHVGHFGGTVPRDRRPERGKSLYSAAAESRRPGGDMRRLRHAAGLLLASLVLAGCTLVPTDANPQHVPRGAVPFGLSSPTLPTPTLAPSQQTLARTIWLVDATGQLAPVVRQISTPALAPATLRSPVSGPTDIEAAEGLRVPSRRRSRSVRSAAPVPFWCCASAPPIPSSPRPVN